MFYYNYNLSCNMVRINSDITEQDITGLIELPSDYRYYPTVAGSYLNNNGAILNSGRMCNSLTKYKYYFKITSISLYNKITNEVESANIVDYKKEDKLPAGNKFDVDLWEFGYNDEYIVLGIDILDTYLLIGGNYQSNYDLKLFPLFELSYNKNYYYYTIRNTRNIVTYGASNLNPYPLKYTTSDSYQFNNFFAVMENVKGLDSNGILIPYYSPDIDSEFIENTNDIGNDYVLSWGSSTGSNTTRMIFKGTAIPIKDIFSLLALTGIPFTLNYNTNPDISQDKVIYDNNFYCGIFENGIAYGDYVQGSDIDISKTDVTENPDLEPLNPQDDEEILPNDSGNIPTGSLPPDIVNTFTRLYLMDARALNIMGSNLWGEMLSYTPGKLNILDNFTFIKYYNPVPDNYDLNITLSNVIDYFTSLRYYPIPNIRKYVNNTLTDGIYIGTGVKKIEIEQGVVCQVNNNVFQMDGGFIGINKIRERLYNNFLDYEPLTSVSLYVPYCGTIELQPSTIFDKSMQTISITYCVDITSGMMTAIIYKNGVASFPIGAIKGSIGFDIPMTGNDANSVKTQAQIKNEIFERTQIGNITSSSIPKISFDPSSMILGSLNGIIKSGYESIIDSLNYINSFPLIYGTSPVKIGSATDLSGILSPHVAYIQISRHRTVNNKAYPDNYNKTYGFLHGEYDKIGNQKGMVICVNPLIENISCTEREKSEIYSLLTSGIYIK